MKRPAGKGVEQRQVRSDTHIGWRSSWVGEIQMGESPRSSLVSGVTATRVFTVFKLFVFVFAKEVLRRIWVF